MFGNNHSLKKYVELGLSPGPWKIEKIVLELASHAQVMQGKYNFSADYSNFTEV
jgi:hypothetical protein